MKQILVVRRDLKMRRGKEIAQGAHASVGVIFSSMDDGVIHPLIHKWIKIHHQAKITVYVNSEEELLQLKQLAENAGLLHYLVTDHGRTEFNGVHTNTVLAIGPDEDDKINPITGHLQLY